MELGGKWPVSIVATPDVAAGARLWRTAGTYRLTIVVKATFALVHQQTALVVAPDPIVVDDVLAGGDESRSVLAASDLAPYLPRGEVMFVGNAHSQTGGVPALSVRLAVYGGKPLVEKTLHVVGPRTLGENGAGPPELFVELPITYEHALRGAMDENPAGIVPQPGGAMPTVLDPDDASGPAGFGPLSPRWAGRRRLLRQLDPSLLDAAVPELPDAFAWSYFQAAPPDQRCPFLVGDEWIVLDNLWRGLARIETRLPGARGAARLYDGAQHMEVPLVADTLTIDGERGVASLVWRGNVAVDAARLASMEVLAGLELPGRPIPWPGEPAPQPASAEPPMAPAPVAAASSSSGSAPPPQQQAPTPESAYGYHTPAPGPQATSAHDPSHEAQQQAMQAHAVQQAAEQQAAMQAAAMQTHAMQTQAVQAMPAPQRHPSEPPHQGHQVTPPSGQPAVPSPRSPSGAYQAVAKNPSGSYQAVGGGQDPGRAPQPSYGMRYPTPTPGSHQAARSPTPRPIEPPPPAPPRSEEDDGGHTVMRQVDAKLLEQLAAIDGPTTVGRTPLPLPVPAAPGGYDDRNESTAFFAMRPDTTLMRIARGEAPSPVSEAFAASAHASVHRVDASEPVMSQAAVSQAETARRPTAEHELVDEQTFVHDDAEIQRLLADSTAVSSRGSQLESPEESTSEPATLPPPRDEGPLTQSDAHASSAPPTMAAPTTIPLPGSDAARRQHRYTSRGLGPVHVVEASAVASAEPPAPAEPPARSLAVTKAAPTSLDATRPGKDSMKQALRDELMRRLVSGQPLADAHLENADLSDLDLSGQNLARALLRGARFDRSKLDGADLSGAKLEGAHMAGVSLTGANLIGANLDGAILDGAQLLSAQLDDASLVAASLAGVLLVDATATRASFREAELRDARLDRSRLCGADFERARMTNATFLSCDLTDASFFEAAGNSASFVEATLTNARFDQSHFALAKFARAAATDTLWNEAVLDGASFEAASLTGAAFAKSSCQGAIFSSADLCEARFQRALLDGAVFTGADIEGAVFDSPEGPPTGPHSGPMSSR